MKRKKNKILIYLLILVLLFFNITAISFAKYLNSILINGASDIAKYDVKFSSTDSDTKEFDLDSTNYFGNYKFNIVSNSETSLNYDIVLSSLPNDLNVSLDNKTFKTSNNGKVECKNAGTIKGSTTEQTSTNTLYFTYLKDKDAFNNKIKIDINFNQDKPIKEANSIIKSAYAKYVSSLSKEIEIKIPVAEVSYEDWFVTYQNEPKVLIRTQKKFLPVGRKATRDDITKSGDYHKIDLTPAYFYNGKGSNDIIVSKDEGKNVLKRYCGGNMDVNVYTPSDAEKYPQQFSASDYEKNDYEYRYLQDIVHFDIDIGDGRYSAKNVVDQSNYTQFYYGDKVKIRIDDIKEGFLLDTIYWNAWDNPREEMTESNNEYIRVLKESPLNRNKIPTEQGIHIESKFKNYNITYNLNGGKETTPLKRTYTIQDSYLIPSATYEGLGFEMWINEQTNQRLDKIEKGSTGDLFLKANYSKELVPVKAQLYLGDINKNPYGGVRGTSSIVKYYAPGAVVSAADWQEYSNKNNDVVATPSIIVSKDSENICKAMRWEHCPGFSITVQGNSIDTIITENVNFRDESGNVIKHFDNFTYTLSNYYVSKIDNRLEQIKSKGDIFYLYPFGWEVTNRKATFKENYTLLAGSNEINRYVLRSNSEVPQTQNYRVEKHSGYAHIWDSTSQNFEDRELGEWASYQYGIFDNVINYFDITEPGKETQVKVAMKDIKEWYPYGTIIKFNSRKITDKFVITPHDNDTYFTYRYMGNIPYKYWINEEFKEQKLNLSYDKGGIKIIGDQLLLSRGGEYVQNAYGVRFNPNGAMLDKDKDTVQGTMQNEFIPNYGDDVNRKLTKNTFKDDYREFLGWSRDKNAKTPEFTDEAILPKNLFNTCSVGDLYAVWSEKASAKENTFSGEEEENEIDNSSLNKDAESKENITETNETNTSKLEDNTLEDLSKENNSISNENTIKEEDTNITLDNTVEEDTKNIIKENTILDNNISNEVKPNEIAENIIKDVNISSNETSKENVIE